MRSTARRARASETRHVKRGPSALVDLETRQCVLVSAAARRRGAFLLQRSWGRWRAKRDGWGVGRFAGAGRIAPTAALKPPAARPAFHTPSGRLCRTAFPAGAGERISAPAPCGATPHPALRATFPRKGGRGRGDVVPASVSRSAPRLAESAVDLMETRPSAAKNSVKGRSPPSAARRGRALDRVWLRKKTLP